MNKYKYIYEVYKEKSFSKAAKKLYITQSALSQYIKNIENELKINLFDRSSKPIKPTDIGLIFIKHSKEILEAENNLDKKIGDYVNLEIGNLKLGGTSFLISKIYPKPMKKLVDQHPKIHIDLIEDKSDKLVKLVEDYEIDLTYVSEDMTSDKFMSKLAFTDNILLAIPKLAIPNSFSKYQLKKEEISCDEYSKNYKKLLNPSLLKDSKLNYIILKEGNNLYDLATYFLNKYELKVDKLLYVDQLLTSYHLTKAGLGASFVSSKIAKDDYKDDIGYFILDPNSCFRRFYSLVRRNKYTPFACKKFMELLAQ